MNIGVIGAIGVDDIGDVIMLESDLKLLEAICSSNDICSRFTLFTFNKELSRKQLTKFDFEAELAQCINKENISYEIIREVKFQELLKMDLNKIIDNKEFMDKFIECDVLFFIGGGYFNSYWGDRLIPTFVLPIALGYQYKKPIFISGINLGPFNESQTNRFNGMFKEVNTLTIRDREDSIKMLEKLGGTDGKLVLGCDDILPRWYGNNKSDTKVVKKKKVKYATIQLHHWVEKYSENYIQFYKEFSTFLTGLIDDNKIDKIYYLPFNNYKGVDYECGRRLKAFMNDIEEFVLIEPLDDYIEMREIISNSEFVIASRYHPIVFGLGEQVPTLAICVNDLYKQKISGAFDVVEVDKEINMVNINEFSNIRLVKWYKRVESKGYFKNTDITNKILKYDIERRSQIESFLAK